jgi:multimeric flavodoxin WrbA
MIIHDHSQQDFEAIGIRAGSDIVVSDNGTIKNCIGCFGCWVKTPGVCVLKDDYRHMGERLVACDELIVISSCIYGSYSPFIRNVWDRSIPYLLPYFVTRNGETHHRARYPKRLEYAVYFYGGDITESEAETARRLVRANAKNFHAKASNVFFVKELSDIKEALQ